MEAGDRERYLVVTLDEICNKCQVTSENTNISNVTLRMSFFDAIQKVSQASHQVKKRINLEQKFSDTALLDLEEVLKQIESHVILFTRLYADAAQRRLFGHSSK